VYSPRTWSIPADIAISSPKFRDSFTRRAGRPASIQPRTISAERSDEPSSTKTTSDPPSSGESAVSSRSQSSGRLSSSSSIGTTTDKSTLTR
jgi:hypothetical protein